MSYASHMSLCDINFILYLKNNNQKKCFHRLSKIINNPTHTQTKEHIKEHIIKQQHMKYVTHIIQKTQAYKI